MFRSFRKMTKIGLRLDKSSCMLQSKQDQDPKIRNASYRGASFELESPCNLEVVDITIR